MNEFEKNFFDQIESKCGVTKNKSTSNVVSKIAASTQKINVLSNTYIAALSIFFWSPFFAQALPKTLNSSLVIGKFKPVGTNIISSSLNKKKQLNNLSSSIEQEFKDYSQKWYSETMFFSSPDKIVSHPDYQKIIHMGPKVIPYILEELKKQPHFWFFALRQLTGVNPVPLEIQGKINLMTASWLEWGRKNGYTT